MRSLMNTLGTLIVGICMWWPAQAAILTYSPGKVLFLENSIVDLERNIEILKFDWTAGQNFCDIYASVYGVKRTSSRCQNFEGYTTPKFTSHNGWRIGDGTEVLGVYSLLSQWTTVNAPYNWLYSYQGPDYTQWMDEWRSPHTFSGRPSFLVNTLSGSGSDPSSTNIRQIDWTSSSPTAGNVRFSYSNLTGDQSDTSTLLVRDWLGEERPLFGVSTPVGAFAGLLLMAAMRRRWTR